MIKQISTIEIEINSKSFRFLCETDSTFGEVHDALSKMKTLLIQRMQEIDQSQEVKPNVNT